jgi:hypothetical protein
MQVFPVPPFAEWTAINSIIPTRYFTENPGFSGQPGFLNYRNPFFKIINM